MPYDVLGSPSSTIDESLWLCDRHECVVACLHNIWKPIVLTRTDVWHISAKHQLVVPRTMDHVEFGRCVVECKLRVFNMLALGYGASELSVVTSCSKQERTNSREEQGERGGEGGEEDSNNQKRIEKMGEKGGGSRQALVVLGLPFKFNPRLHEISVSGLRVIVYCFIHCA